jgi:AraC-like DNA-binding protein
VGWDDKGLDCDDKRRVAILGDVLRRHQASAERGKSFFNRIEPDGGLPRPIPIDDPAPRRQPAKRPGERTEMPAMRHLTQLPSITPEMIAKARPPGAAGALRFSLDGVPEHEKPLMMREFFGRSLVKYDVEQMPDASFDIDVTLQMVPGMMIMSGRGHGFCNRRTREMVALENSDDLAMVLNIRGDRCITLGQRELVLGDGEAVMMSMTEISSYKHRPPGDILTLRVPRRTLSPLLNGAADDRMFRRIPAQTRALKMLASYLAAACDDHGVVGPDVAHLVAGHVCDLMAVAIGATRDAAEMAQGGGLRAARLSAIKRDIARDLGQPDLSIAMLAVRHGCTPRFIQRLFEAEGTTFTEYVLAQRLVRAHRMLTDPRRAGDKIITIALDAGFSDVSYFHRAFRQLYGDTPSAIRAGRTPS